jgi:hypothetical protein
MGETRPLNRRIGLMLALLISGCAGTGLTPMMPLADSKDRAVAVWSAQDDKLCYQESGSTEFRCK